MAKLHRLPKAQDEILTALVLGGPEAVGRHSTRTVTALAKKGYLDSDGVTQKALDYVAGGTYEEREEAARRELFGKNPGTTRPKYTYKDFVTGKLRWTRGKFLGWFPGGFAGARYAGFDRGVTALFIPEYSLTPETRAMLAAHPKG